MEEYTKPTFTNVPLVASQNGQVNNPASCKHLGLGVGSDSEPNCGYTPPTCVVDPS
jgi:hypothetical protein